MSTPQKRKADASEISPCKKQKLWQELETRRVEVTFGPGIRVITEQERKFFALIEKKCQEMKEEKKK
jgi:hypothetical protein